MTMVEEDVLRTMLRGAADGFAVSDDAAGRILVAARDLEARPRLVGRRREHEGEPDEPPWERAHRPRRIFVATAAAVALVGLTVGAVANWGGSTATNSALPFSPSTTIASAGGALGLPKRTSAASGTVHGDLGAPAQAPAQTTSPPLPTGAVGQPSKVEETGSVGLTVGRGRLETVLTKLTDLAVANGGFAASTQTQAGAAGGGGTPSYGNITLQVPQASFGNVIDLVRSFGTVTALSTKGTDVTGQYVDLQSRIGALQASRDQYLTIMSKATSISDILAVQNQLDSLQSQLEQLQGQLQVLDNQTTYSTLAVSVVETGAHRTVPPRPASGIGDAWHGAVSGFAAAFDGLVRIAGPALFVVLCLVAVIVLGRVTWRGVRRRTL